MRNFWIIYCCPIKLFLSDKIRADSICRSQLFTFILKYYTNQDSHVEIHILTGILQTYSSARTFQTPSINNFIINLVSVITAYCFSLTQATSSLQMWSRENKSTFVVLISDHERKFNWISFCPSGSMQVDPVIFPPKLYFDINISLKGTSCWFFL